MCRELEYSPRFSQTGSGGGGDCPPFGANWQPDHSNSSPLAREWLQANQQSMRDALQRNPDNTYTVQFGDCLSSVAQRALHDGGNGNPTDLQITDEMKQIVKANDDNYQSLDKYPDQLQTGWNMAIPSRTDTPSTTDAPSTIDC